MGQKAPRSTGKRRRRIPAAGPRVPVHESGPSRDAEPSRSTSHHPQRAGFSGGLFPQLPPRCLDPVTAAKRCPSRQRGARFPLQTCTNLRLRGEDGGGAARRGPCRGEMVSGVELDLPRPLTPHSQSQTRSSEGLISLIAARTRAPARISPPQHAPPQPPLKKSSLKLTILGARLRGTDIPQLGGDAGVPPPQFQPHRTTGAALGRCYLGGVHEPAPSTAGVREG